MRLSLALVFALALAPAFALAQPQRGSVLMQPEPIEGLSLERQQNESVDVDPNASADLAFRLENRGNATLSLTLEAFELDAPDARRFLSVELDAPTLRLDPGASARAIVRVAPRENVSGVERAVAFMVRAEDRNGTSNAPTMVRVTGPTCEGCPAPGSDSGGFFRIERPAGSSVTTAGGGNVSTTPPPAAPEEYAEAPGPGLAVALLALAGCALVGRRAR